MEIEKGRPPAGAATAYRNRGINELQFRPRQQGGAIDIMGMAAALAGGLDTLLPVDVAQLKLAFPFDTATIRTSGNNAKLNSTFTVQTTRATSGL